ncbi:MAG: hydantoinase B/oxoprolinase family protein, partial [Rhodospirillales bacterium]|nr:hydantoinase B/oxoprolinase family protein [Rhodospirillales bacterium]
MGAQSTGYGAGLKVTDPWMEGLQLDQLKIYRTGELNEGIHQMLSDNIRYPESSLGDMRAQIAACKLAERRLDELYNKFGVDILTRATERIFDETEAKCRLWVANVPDGVYEAESFIDEDDSGDGQPVPIHAKVVIEGDDMTIDLSRCSGERKTAMNSRTYAGPRVAYKALTAPLEPVNEGSFRALDAVIPEGNFMMARYPAPMSSWSMAIPCVVDTTLAALSAAIPDQIPAAHQGMMGGGLAFFGDHPDTGKPFVLQTSEGAGWGGRPFEDGESATKTVCQGDVRNGAMEGDRAQMPGADRGARAAARFGGRRRASRRARHRPPGAQRRRGALEPVGLAAQLGAAVGPVGRQAGLLVAVPPAAARAERLRGHGRPPPPGAGRLGGDRQDRRRRRLGRSAGARSGARA